MTSTWGEAGGSVPVGAVPGTLKLVKNAVVFIKGTQLAPEIIVHLWGHKQIMIGTGDAQNGTQHNPAKV